MSFASRQLVFSQSARAQLHHSLASIRGIKELKLKRKCRVNLSFVETDSQDMKVENGPKPPIIFLHGMTSAKEYWKDVMRPIAVATGRKAYAYDARNHGDSGWSDEIDYAVMQDDLLGFMGGIQVKKAVLIGHSMGGRTAMFFASNMPEMVEKLVVEDISPKPTEHNLRIQAQKYLQLLEYTLDQIPPQIKDLNEAKNFVHAFLQEKTPENQRSTKHGCYDGSSLPLRQNENGKFCWKTNLKAIENKFLGVPNVSRIKGVYPGPTLMLYGTKSPYKVSGDRDFVRQFFPNSQFRAVEGATHQIHLEYQEVFLKEVVEFLNES